MFKISTRFRVGVRVQDRVKLLVIVVFMVRVKY